MNLDKAIEKRHCVRRYKSKKPDWRKIIKAVESSLLAPLAGNIPTVKFILVSEKEKIHELAKASTQDFVGTAHFALVVCSNPTQCVRSYDKRAERYCRQQAGAAMENLFLKLTDLGLATCWVGAFSDTTVKRILKIPNEIDVEAIFPVGYEIEKIKQRKKPHIDSCIFFNTWNNKYMVKKTSAGRDKI